jgi:hypothetical protein
MVTKKSNIRVRCFRSSDTQKVFELFEKETAYGRTLRLVDFIVIFETITSSTNNS